MKIPMAILAFGALFAGYLQVPHVDDFLTEFLEPTFAAATVHLDPSNSLTLAVLIIDGLCSIAGIGLAWFLYVHRPGTAAKLIERFGWLHRFLYNRWYFDELYDYGIVRPLRATGRFFNDVFERVVVDGMVNTVTQVVKQGNSLLRVAQGGLLRSYTLLLMAGVFALALYFLVVAR